MAYELILTVIRQNKSNESVVSDCWFKMYVLWLSQLEPEAQCCHPEHIFTIFMWLFAAAHYCYVQQPHLQRLSFGSILQVSRKAWLPGLTHSSSCFLPPLCVMCLMCAMGCVLLLLHDNQMKPALKWSSSVIACKPKETNLKLSHITV